MGGEVRADRLYGAVVIAAGVAGIAFLATGTNVDTFFRSPSPVAKQIVWSLENEHDAWTCDHYWCVHLTGTAVWIANGEGWIDAQPEKDVDAPSLIMPREVDGGVFASPDRRVIWSAYKSWLEADYISRVGQFK